VSDVLNDIFNDKKAIDFLEGCPGLKWVLEIVLYLLVIRVF
jgi:hypothetical protein